MIVLFIFKESSPKALAPQLVALRTGTGTMIKIRTRAHNRYGTRIGARTRGRIKAGTRTKYGFRTWHGIGSGTGTKNGTKIGTKKVNRMTAGTRTVINTQTEAWNRE